MNAPHPRDCTTEQLLALLRGTCGEAGDAAALLVEWFIDNQTALLDALSQARADIAELQQSESDLSDEVLRMGQKLISLGVSPDDA